MRPMSSTPRKVNVIASLCVLLALSSGFYGCAAFQPQVKGNARPVTKIETILAWNAALANANLAIGRAVIAANETVPPLIDVPTANTVLTEQSKIADANRQLTHIFAAACSEGPDIADATKTKITCLHGAQIQALLTTTRESAKKLSVDVGIKNPSTAQVVLASATTILGLAAQITAALQAAGVVQ